MIGNIFSKFFQFLIAMLKSIGSFLKDAFQSLFDMLFDLFRWLGELLARLFQALIDVLVSFFMVIYELIKGLLYLLYMIGVCAAKLFLILWEVAKLIWAFVVGLTTTFQSIFFTPGSGSGHGYGAVMGRVASGLNVLQMDVVAYILLFGIWIFGAFGVIKIIGSLRGVGE
ncbi:hypothetical protein [Lysinibacillus sphaericus]|uniref:LP1G.10 n=2 Tax=Lysinibacillus sphaericus TaxID=1421 RepID=Q7WYK3_LYSSH|nr:hypothetical protein [Lysinibacillus sphaericus]AAP86245.1 LP1G.10 [Lysinibacillus sphaericus]